MIVYVDVDDTLIRSTGLRKIPVPETVAHVRRLKEDGVTLFCWSAGGADYARECAEFVGLADVFEAFLPKPRVMIDDQLVSDWPFCVTVHPNWCAGRSWNDYLSIDLEPGKMND